MTPAAGAAQTASVTDADHVVEQTAFTNAVQRNPSFFSDWGGGVTAGASLVQATQESRTFTGAVNLVRTVPDEDWLRRRNRTEVDLSLTYGTLEQPATPTVKTDIYHGSLQRDEYISTSLFAFAQGSFDHNFSQGLDLQQTYAGGLGWSVIKRGNESLDLKAGITYVRQSFQTASADRNLMGSTFEEDFQRGLRRGIKFSEQLIIAGMDRFQRLDRNRQRDINRTCLQADQLLIGHARQLSARPAAGIQEEFVSDDDGVKLHAALSRCLRADARRFVGNVSSKSRHGTLGACATLALKRA